MRLLLGLLSVVLLTGSCGKRIPEMNPGRKPVSLLFLKKKMSLRNTGIQMGYALGKKPKKQYNGGPMSPGWTLSFSDEFDSLDLHKWRPGQPWGEVHPDNLHQYYDASEVSVQNGFLMLGGTYKPKTIRVRDSLHVIPYAVGLINSDISFRQKYGYFEIRSKNPAGPATWPAFWLTGATRWPPEIDIFEMYGRKKGKSIHNQYTSIHWGKTDTRSRGYLTRKINLPDNSDQAFHIYGCEWSPEHIRFYTDGRLTGHVRVNKRLQQWLDDEMVVIINNCFDARYLKYLPADFKGNCFVVDWVRVWKKNEG